MPSGTPYILAHCAGLEWRSFCLWFFPACLHLVTSLFPACFAMVPISSCMVLWCVVVL